MANVEQCATWRLGLAAAVAAIPFLGACQPLSQRDLTRSGTAQGAQKTTDTRPRASLHYLDGDAIDELARLIPAPVDSESLPAREMEEHLTALMQSHASPVAAAAAGSVASDELWRYSRALGQAISAFNCPRMVETIAKAQADADAVKNELKTRFARSRPGAKPNAPFNGNPEQWSYPSGSATRAALQARLLTAIAPQHEEALLREAWFIAHDRLVVGAHFPSDVVAGFALGQAIADRMLKSQEMQTDLEAARREWRSLQPEP